MAITLIFGLPGSGKTTSASQVCVDEAYKIKMGQSRYKEVITNAPITCEGVYKTNDFSWLGEYYREGALMVVDEATLLWDSRNYKVFAKNLVKGFVLHRHTKNDVIIYVQIWNRLDKTIRDICDRVYFAHKGVLFKNITYLNHIPYRILFPESGDNAGDIVMGYQRCGFFARLTSKRIYRPYYYPYFDSYWIPEDMKKLPDHALEKFWLRSDAPRQPLYPLTFSEKIYDRYLSLRKFFSFKKKK